MSFADNKTLYIVGAYLLIINLLLFFTMGIDKLKAKSGGRRVPEARLFFLALIGGSLGGIAGMQLFRHKTKHNSFRIGFPLVFVFHLGIGLLLIYIKNPL